MRRHIGTVVVAFLAVLLWRSPPTAAGQAPTAAGQAPTIAGQAQAAELDLVVETNLCRSPQHTKAYLEAMRDYARKGLGGLVAVQPRDPATPPKDGAAPYRLFIRHTGGVEVEEVTAPANGVGGPADGVRQLVARQKGTFTFRLAEWTGSGYPTVDQWSSRFVMSHYVAVARHVTPEAMSGYRREVLMLAMPEAVTRGILNHILPIRLAEVSGGPAARKTCTVTVRNRSRWPLGKLTAKVIWCEKVAEGRYRYEAKPQYDGRLAPGKEIALKSTAVLAPSQIDWEYDLPTQIEAVPTFVPTGGEA